VERGKCSVQTVVSLAAMAGFHFSPARCEILAPQLEWVLKEAARLEGGACAGLEPAAIFSPPRWWADQQEREV